MNKKYLLPLLIFWSILSTNALAQNGVGINTITPQAALDVVSTTTGILIPRMTSAQRVAISSPPTASLVYQTDGTIGFYFYDGSTWRPLLSNSVGSGGGWGLTGNTGTTAGTNFIGTTDAQDVVLKSNSTEYLRITTTGNVGIGTASPTHKLMVSGGFLGGDNSGSFATKWSGDNHHGIWYRATVSADGTVITASDQMTYREYGSANGGHHFWTGGASQTERFRITNNYASFTTGNVGIGTTSPAAKLQIANGDGSFALFGPNASWGAYLYVGAGTSVVSSGVAQVISTNGNLHLDAGVGQNMYLAYYNGSNTFINPSGGNVGIGTTSPGYKLDVNGTGNFSSNVRIVPQSAAWAEGIQFYMPSTSTWGGLRWSRNRAGYDGNWAVGYTGMDATDDFVFTANNGGAQIDNIIRLTKAGNVGIGTASPAYKLDVNGNARVNDKLYFGNWFMGATSSWPNGPGITLVGGDETFGLSSTGGQTSLQIDGGFRQQEAGKVNYFLDNVGIGTTSPNRKLEVVSGNSDGMVLGQQADNSNTIQTYIDGHWSDRTTYAGGCCNALLLQPDVGTVGIGTTGPTSTLDVNGSTRIRSLGSGYVKSDGSGNLSSSAIASGDLPSHTHPWSQVTSKPAAWLDATNLIQDNANFNNSVPSGFYQAYNASNSPTAGTWYNMLNVRHSNPGNDHGFQIAASYYDENIWTRTYQGGSGANNGSFTPWRSLIHSGNLGSNAIINQNSYTQSAGFQISGLGNAGYLHTMTNDSWFPYTGNGYNYFRGTTYAWNAVWYDENDGAYYLDPNGTSRYNYFGRNYGWNWVEYDWNDAAYYTDLNGTSRFNYLGRNYGFNWTEYDWNDAQYYMDLNNVSIVNDIRARIFYDYDNTAFYTNPNGTSLINKIRVDGNGSTSGHWGHDPYGYGWGAPYASFRNLEVSSSGNYSTEPAMLRIHQWGSGAAEFWKPQGTTLYLRETPGGGGSWFTMFEVQGQQRVTSNLFAPIMYDNDNTGYYINANGYSQMSAVLANDWFRAQGQCGLYWQDYGGGWYMQDGTWIRGYNGKSLWMGGGLVGGDGGLTIGYGGAGSPGGGAIIAGAVGIGNSSPSYKLHVNGNIRTTAINESSDIRWKKDIKTLTNSLEKVQALRGVTYNWRRDEFPEQQFDEKEQIGFIAQEVEKIVPQVVSTDKEGFKSVEYSKMVALLTEAIKEQQTQIKTQEAKINEQQQQIEKLTTENKQEKNKAIENDVRYNQLKAQLDNMQALLNNLQKNSLEIKAEQK